MKIRFMAVFFGVLVLLPAPVKTEAGFHGVLMIAHPDLPHNRLDREVISHIYRGKQVKWDSGDTIVVVMQKSGPVHEAFAEFVVGTSPEKLLTVWKKIIFTGTGNPPKIFRKESDLVRFVSETRGAIGYIHPHTSHKGVKEIFIK